MPRNTQLQIARAGRRRRAAELRLRGATQDEIAAELCITQSCVSKDLARVVSDERAVAAEALRELRVHELEALAEMEASAVSGFDRTAKRGWLTTRLSIQERRSRLCGLDSPKTAAIQMQIEHKADLMGNAGELAVVAMLDRLEAAGVASELGRAALIAMGVEVLDLDLAERIRAERRRVADVAGNGDATDGEALDAEPEPAGMQGLL